MSEVDELMELWQQGASSRPDPAEVARLAGRASVTRFDKAILRRNFAEYLGFAVVAAFAIFQAVIQGEIVRSAATLLCAGFSVGYLWWHHRRLTPPDPLSDARAYQSAMLHRIDRQIRLLRTMRYWYLLPLYVPVAWTLVVIWPHSPVAAALGWLGTTAAYIFLGWLNERVGVPRLESERSRIQNLYEG